MKNMNERASNFLAVCLFCICSSAIRSPLAPFFLKQVCLSLLNFEETPEYICLRETIIYVILCQIKIHTSFDSVHGASNASPEN